MKKSTIKQATETIASDRASVAAARKVLAKISGTKSTKLLTAGKANPKTDKENKTENKAKIETLTAIMHLAPAKTSGYNTCTHSTIGCENGCLNKSGNPLYMEAKLKARHNRTIFMFEHWADFLIVLAAELRNHCKRAAEAGKVPALRPNGTSDMVWEAIAPVLFEMFPDVIVYDYTKVPNRLARTLPKNYTLTLSRSETNDALALEHLAAGGTVAVVVNDRGISAHPKPLPKIWRGFPTFDGDSDERRFLDPAGHWIVLRAKGPARKDTSGWVVDMSNPATWTGPQGQPVGLTVKGRAA